MRGKTQNYYTWEYDINKHGEPGGGISETIPDEAMTMREIVERHIRGQQDLTMIKNPGFDPNADLDSMDLEKIPGMDLFDKEEILETIKSDIENQKTFFEEKKKQKAQQQRGLVNPDRDAAADGVEIGKRGQPGASDDQGGGTRDDDAEEPSPGRGRATKKTPPAKPEKS